MYQSPPGLYRTEQKGLSYTSCHIIGVITGEYLNWDLCIYAALEPRMDGLHKAVTAVMSLVAEPSGLTTV